MKAILLTFLLFYIGTRAGRMFFAFFKIRVGVGIETIIYETGTGMWLLSLLPLAAGALGHCDSSALLTLIFAAAAVCLSFHIIELFQRKHKQIFPARPTAKSGAKDRRSPAWSYFAVAFILLLVAVNIIRSFVPPSMFDSLSYHLAVPKIYLQTGKIEFIPTLLYSNFSLTAQMLYMPAVAANAVETAALTHTVFGVMTAAATFLWTRKRFGYQTALLASAIFYLNPIVGNQSPMALVDLFTAFYGGCAALLIIGDNDNSFESFSRIALGSLFAGIAVSVKWSCYPVVLICGAWWLADSCIKSRKSKTPFPTIGRIIIVAALFACPNIPYLIKNLVFTGNPVWPVFGGRDMDIESASMIMSGIAGFHGLGPRDITHFLRLPYDVLVNEWAFGSPISPVFICFLPLYVISRKHAAASSMLAYSAIFVLFWFFLISPSLRFLLPVIPLLSIVVAITVRNLESRSLSLLCSGVLAFHLFYGASMNFFGGSGLISEIPFLKGSVSQSEYLHNHPAPLGYSQLQWVNENAEENDIVLLGEIFLFGYYLDKPYFWGHPVFQARYKYREMNDSDDLYNALKKDGITLIIFRRGVNDLYVDEPDIPFLDHKARRIWGDFLREKTCVEFEGTVVRILDNPPQTRMCKVSQ
ncbi:MAG: hypothetical protein BWY28_00482 [bacterium ADurb.Bin236]|nr:MAG: hypothetical protein BWY28_00482 [bacterium ADurb.Bin236]HOY64453.1 hypothetical protein [bacterium]HPN93530.1 hypothetical protein [bacterium]